MEEQLKLEVQELKSQLEMERQRGEIARLKLENEDLRLAALGSGHTSIQRDRLYTKEIPEWTGEEVKSGDAELYLERFDRVADRFGWKDADKKDVLISKLREAAERYLRIHGRELRDTEDWQAVKQLFMRRFGKKRDLLADMRSLLKLKREPGEDYRTYADRHEEAGILAFTMDKLEDEGQKKGAKAVMDRVVLGMYQLGTDVQVRRYLKGQNVKTLEEAVGLAERV